MLPDGYTDLASGKLANVVTCLEMFARPVPRPEPAGFDGSLARLRGGELERYRALFHHVGDPYLWSSRLTIPAEQLRALLDDPAVESYALVRDGSDIGMLELDFRQAGEGEITYFGLDESAIGTGAGTWLMNRAMEIAWSKPIRRAWVHTCTLDHPAAVPFYVRAGFVPFKRQIEILDDPRVLGLVPKDAAPHIPLL